MSKSKILPLATALGALAGTQAVAIDANSAAPANVDPAATTAAEASKGVSAPNTIVSTGENLLGFIVTEHSDGTVVAQHSSHASHASHGSHASHFSSR